MSGSRPSVIVYDRDETIDLINGKCIDIDYKAAMGVLEVGQSFDCNDTPRRAERFRRAFETALDGRTFRVVPTANGSAIMVRES